jgi:Rhs element Vgr protein
MPATSPANISDSTIRYTIYVDGAQIPDMYPVVSVNTIYEVNRIPWAEVVLRDGSVETSTFDISSSATFIPGNTIRITAGYDSVPEKEIFSGVIVKQAIKIKSMSMNLVVTCKHEAVRMTFNKKEENFAAKKDSDIMSSILGTYGFSGSVTATTVQHENLYQKLATDWDFIIARADVCGFILTCETDKIVVGPPKLSTEPLLKIGFGDAIISFSAEISAERQPTDIEASSWDPATLAALKSSSTEPEVNAQGNLSAGDLSGKLSQTSLKLNSGSPMTEGALKEWADSSLLRMRLAAIKGNVSFVGNASVMPGQTITLEGVGDRFNGLAFVSSVNHLLEDGSWTTTVKFGLDQTPMSEFENFSYLPAAGQLPAIHGLQIAVVKKISEDPLSEFRIQVSLSSNSSTPADLWARMSNFYATASAGSSFLPEIGDEVVVGFLESNPGFPVILGSLYSKTRAAELTPADNNNYIKSISTKGKLKISFNDEKKITKIETPGGNTITLDDDAKAVNIVDQNGNSVKMTSSGITIESGKDITLKATGNIVLDATGKVNVTAKQDVAVAGMNIGNTAQVGFTAKGNATAELSASGQTTVKGGIVMIN